MKYEDCVVGLLMRRNRRSSDNTSTGLVLKQPDTRPTQNNISLPDTVQHFSLLYITFPVVSVNFLALSPFFKFTNSNITVLISIPIKGNKYQWG